MDKGFIGPQRNTPHLRKFCPFKPPKGNEQRQFNEEQKRKRVVVECFFGKMYKAWGLARRAYSFDHKTFDVDIENIIMLTNELIRCREDNLSTTDREFYAAFVESRQSRTETRKRKRKESNDKYRNKRKRQRVVGNLEEEIDY